MNIDTYKRYNSLSNFYKEKYGRKVAKISLNANFTCPNKDGKKGYGGCIYCSNSGSGDFAGDKDKSLIEQFFDIKKIMDKKWPNSLYIPYLQANSNTYGSIEKLKETYEPLLKIKDIVGISIATRSDCFNEEIYQYLAAINQKIPVQIELGLQSANQETTAFLNRQETNEEFIKCVNRLHEIGIEIVVHIINGLPNETEIDMLNTIKFINKLPINGIKIHSLLVLKNTKLGNLYLEKPFSLLTLNQYVEITVKQLEILRPDIIIHRLAADGVKGDLIAPLWTQKKLVVMNEIDKLLSKKDSHQGILYSGNEK